MKLQLLSVALGGALGAVSRYLMIAWVSGFAGKHFPFGTLSVNVLGSFVMGLMYVWVIEHLHASAELKAVITVGFLGAFTTFSTFSLETFHFLQRGDWPSAMIYTLASVILCVFAVWLGVSAARFWQ